ncbi:MAG: hypothetical protein V2A56_06420 [bacterium]
MAHSPWTPAQDETIPRDHLNRYPGMEAVDLYKLVFEATSGPEHLGANEDLLLHWLNIESSELDSFNTSDTLLVEPIGGHYVRVHLAHWLASGRSLEQLANLVSVSSVPDDSDAVRDTWYKTLQLFAYGRLEGPSTRDLAGLTRKVRKHGWPPVHHSDLFKTKWDPHYRVVALTSLLPCFTK